MRAHAECVFVSLFSTAPDVIAAAEDILKTDSKTTDKWQT
jgi:hypothetical protein